jgi:hypothetical protein
MLHLLVLPPIRASCRPNTNAGVSAFLSSEFVKMPCGVVIRHLFAISF